MSIGLYTTFLTHFMDWCISLIYGHFSMKWLKREILGHKKVLSHKLLSKKCYAFFSFLFFLFFLSSLFFFFFFFLENEQCEKRFFKSCFGPLFSPASQPIFFAIFFLAIKKKKNKNKKQKKTTTNKQTNKKQKHKKRAQRVYTAKRQMWVHRTYSRGFVRQTFICFLFLFLFFLTLGITYTHPCVGL